MSHTTASANSMIRLAALAIGGIYLYRRFTEGTAEELKASTTIAPLGQFVIGWGVVFFGLSLLAPAAPTLAGNIALLTVVGSVLTNGTQISKDLSAGLAKPVAEREKLVHPGKAGRGQAAASTLTPTPPSHPELQPEKRHG